MANKVYLEEKAKLREEWAGLDKLVDKDVKAFSEKVEVLIKKRPVEEYVDLGSNVIRYHYGGLIEEPEVAVNKKSYLERAKDFGRWVKNVSPFGVLGVGATIAFSGLLYSTAIGNPYSFSPCLEYKNMEKRVNKLRENKEIFGNIVTLGKLEEDIIFETIDLEIKKVHQEMLEFEEDGLLSYCENKVRFRGNVVMTLFGSGMGIALLGLGLHFYQEQKELNEKYGR